MKTTFNHLLKELKTIFVGADNDSVINIALSLLSCGRDISYSIELAEKYSSENDILKELYEENINFIHNVIDRQNKTVGILEMTFFGGQLKYLAKKINASSQYNCLSIILNLNVEKNNSINKLSEFLNTPFIFIPDEKLLRNFSFLDVVVLNEGYIFKTPIPESIPRIIQPHGLDVLSDTSIKNYGGATIGNYVLAPMQEGQKDEKLYLDHFPRKMIEHKFDFTCVIPCGFPKLDEFIEKCQNNEEIKPKIVLHFTHTSFQSQEACQDIGKTLKLLLDNFLEHEIVFRPFPTELNEPLVINAWESVKNNPRAFLSTNSSYIDDYSGADFLVTHRIETGQTFAYATGNPIIHFPIEENSSKAVEHPRGYLVYTHEQLIQTGMDILANKDKARNRIIKYRNKLLCNPGGAVDYIIENLEYVIQSKRHPDWQYFTLFDKSVEVNYEQEFEEKLEKALKNNFDLENMARSAVSHYPKNEWFKCYLMIALFNAPATKKDHYYFRWFEAMEISVALHKDSLDEKLKEYITDLYIKKLFSKLYQLRNYINETPEPFNILMAESLTLSEFEDYIKDCEQKVNQGIVEMHKLLDDSTLFQKRFKNFIQQYEEENIVIWGAGETIDCLIPMLSNQITIVDKKLFGSRKVLKDSLIMIQKPDSIRTINPDVIIVASNVFFIEISQEIRKNHPNIDIIHLEEFNKEQS
jgi:hypothetical protein